MRIRCGHLLIQSLLAIYACINKTGVLQLSPVRGVFIRSYFLYKRYVEDLLYLLLQRYPALVQSGTVLDIGANIGYTASVFSRFVTNGSKVIAFEPDARNFEILQDTANRYGPAGRIETVQAAVGDKQGQVELLVNECHHADHKIATDCLKASMGNSRAEYVSVPMYTVDAFLRERADIGPISCIKIDVQGYEIGVCRGMQETLATNPDAIVIFEHSPQSSLQLGFDAEEVPRFFLEQGYTLYSFATGGTLSVVPNLDILAGLLERGPGYTDLVASKRSLNP